jgi:membrane protease YdiL (CAAX protease family)
VRRFLAPLVEADRPAMLSVIGGLFLLGIYIYQGQAGFFLRHLGPSLGETPFLAWWAFGYQFASALLLMGLIPALWIRLGLRQRLRDHGLRLGAVRFGLMAVLIGVAALALPLYLNAGSAAFQAEYPLVKLAGRSASLYLLWELTYLVYYIAWEFFFRGFWQLGLQGPLGAAGAMALQTAASTLMHIGKPQGETLAAIVAGPGFGLIALRTGSVLYPLLLHWLIGALTDLFCLLRAPGAMP